MISWKLRSTHSSESEENISIPVLVQSLNQSSRDNSFELEDVVRCQAVMTRYWRIATTGKVAAQANVKVLAINDHGNASSDGVMNIIHTPGYCRLSILKEYSR